MTKNEEKITQKGSAEELVDLIGACEEPDTMHLIDDALEERYRNGKATIKHLSDAVDAEAERYGFFFTDCQKQFGDAIKEVAPRDFDVFQVMIQPTLEMLENEEEASTPGM